MPDASPLTPAEFVPRKPSSAAQTGVQRCRGSDDRHTFARVSRKPNRRRREELWVLASALLVLAVCGVVPPGPVRIVQPGAVVVALAIAGWAWRQRLESTSVAVLLAALITLTRLGVLWQIAMPLSVGALWLSGRMDPRLRIGGFPRGSIPVLPTLICSAVTPLALVLWVYGARPDLGDLTGAIPDVHPALLALGAGLFAVVNAVFEEWIWRGFIQQRSTDLLGVRSGIMLQAGSFGLIHAWGFPRGTVGVLLVGVWALALGALRQWTGGLRAVIVAHVVADATVAAIVLLWLRSLP